MRVRLRLHFHLAQCDDKQTNSDLSLKYLVGLDTLKSCDTTKLSVSGYPGFNTCKNALLIAQLFSAKSRL